MAASSDLELKCTPLPRSCWWHRLHAEPNACIRLWCFPCIGSGTALWRPWVRPLVGAADLISVSLPGREARLNEAPLTKIDALVEALVRELVAQTDERDVFFGHGFGALLAFELARALRDAGAAGPRGLVVCGAPAPDLTAGRLPLHRRPPGSFIRGVEHRYGVIPAEFHERPEFLELLLPSLRADIEALETYHCRPAPPLDIPVLALVGEDDRLLSKASVLGWREHTRSRFEMTCLPGGHFVFTEQPLQTATRVRDFLATL